MSSPATAGPAIVSWSGGKDSTLVLARAREQGVEVAGLVCMFSPETGTSRSHNLPRDLLEAAARAHGLALHVAHASWADYEARFKELLRTLAGAGVRRALFGDIYLDEHRAWVERVCAEAGLEAHEPLWGESTAALAAEVIERGIEARVCTVRLDRLEPSWVGRPLDRALLADLAARGIDPCGEQGEYHTVVVAAPGMAGRIAIEQAHVETSAGHAHWVIERWRLS